MIIHEEQYGNYIFITISDTGINHRIKNIPNQDSALYYFSEDDFVMAISDGVGSCIKADIGSCMAVKAAKKVFVDMKDGTLLPYSSNIVNHLIKEWNTLIDDEKVDDYCATLKVAIKIKNKIMLISIGDGLLAVTSVGKTMSSPIDNSVFANVTSCLNRKVNEKDFWIGEFSLTPCDSFVVFSCTDGVTNGLQEGRELELVQEIEKSMDMENLRDELESLIVDISEVSSDDRTVGVIKYEWKNAEPHR